MAATNIGNATERNGNDNDNDNNQEYVVKLFDMVEKFADRLNKLEHKMNEWQMIWKITRYQNQNHKISKKKLKHLTTELFNNLIIFWK